MGANKMCSSDLVCWKVMIGEEEHKDFSASAETFRLEFLVVCINLCVHKYNSDEVFIGL